MSDERRSIKRAAALANGLSALLTDAIEDGVDEGFACSVAIMVIADYGRIAFGPEYLQRLCDTLIKRSTDPLPRSVTQ